MERYAFVLFFPHGVKEKKRCFPKQKRKQLWACWSSCLFLDLSPKLRLSASSRPALASQSRPSSTLSTGCALAASTAQTALLPTPQRGRAYAQQQTSALTGGSTASSASRKGCMNLFHVRKGTIARQATGRSAAPMATRASSARRAPRSVRCFRPAQRGQTQSTTWAASCGQASLTSSLWPCSWRSRRTSATASRR